jgi:hypothetical protein
MREQAPPSTPRQRIRSVIADNSRPAPAERKSHNGIEAVQITPNKNGDRERPDTVSRFVPAIMMTAFG